MNPIQPGSFTETIPYTSDPNRSYKIEYTTFDCLWKFIDLQTKTFAVPSNPKPIATSYQISNKENIPVSSDQKALSQPDLKTDKHLPDSEIESFSDDDVELGLQLLLNLRS
jgi:hypothetical protein